MSSHVEKIKEKLSIVDVIGSYVALEKAGANFKAKCPFHNEKTASFFISPTRNSYYCFGCGAKGDIFEFVQQFEGLDFVGALRVLAKRAGVELVRENKAARTERERLYLTLEYATLFFQKQLSLRKDVLEYLKKRGLEEKTIREWRLGYAPSEWRALSQFLEKKNISREDIEKVGLTKRSEKSRDDRYDRFRGRIIFPISDSSGRVVAFSGRQFESDGTEAKYLNSPETALFEKSKILYGYDRAKLEIRRRDQVILVEGQMDLLMAHQGGFLNTVATSGTALTQDQLITLHRLTHTLVIAFDGDEAGGRAAKRGWQLALSLGFDVKIATLPQGIDPADLIKENPKAFEKAIAAARHSIDVELERIVRDYTDKREILVAVEKELLPLIAVLQSTTEKSHFISKIAHECGAKESILWEVLRKVETKVQSPHEAQSSVTEAVQSSRRDMLARRIYGIIVWQENQKKPLIDIKDAKEKVKKFSTDDVNSFASQVDNIQDELIFEAELSYGKSPHLVRHLEELLLALREEHVRDKFSEAMQKLHKAEQAKDAPKTIALLKECQQLSEELKSIAEQKLMF